MASTVILALSLAAGCAGEDGDADLEAIGAVENELTRADSIVDPANTGVVEFINSNGVCSGTLVRNGWVLSASHCWAGGWDQVAGAYVVMGTQSAWVQAAFPVSYAGVVDASTDAMLLKLDRPLVMNGSTTGWQRGLANSLALRQGTQLGCWGYGQNDSGGIDHQLRLTVDEYTNGWVGTRLALRSYGGQHIQPGDSGGPCLYFDGTIVGVIHGQEVTGSGLGQDLITPSDMFRFWFDFTLANN